MPTDEEITRHHDADPDEDPWVHGPPAPLPLAVVDPDPAWPARFTALAAAIRAALGDTALAVEHVGSTSVPDLPAKDVIDIDLTVADPRAEHTYVPPLERLGYDLIIREPSWHEHRCLRLTTPAANLHVFAPDCPEPIRHRMFRDWLTTHPDDRARYATAKRAALADHAAGRNYNLAKEAVIRDIYDRLFRAAGML